MALRRVPSGYFLPVCWLLLTAGCVRAPQVGAGADDAPGRVAEVARARGESFDGRALLVERLDSIVADALRREPLAGVAVAVLRGRDTLLQRGYGFADLGLGVAVTNETTFRFLSPVTGAAIMQQVERGRLRLTDDASQVLPEFPWQGRRVTIRQLMDATSGLPDFHYLGDALIAQRAVPKATDEVTALFSHRPFTHEPGERWQWTISGFHLAGVLLERISAQSYPDYVRDHVLTPAQLSRSYYCDDRAVVPGLARGYEAIAQHFVNYPLESATLYPFIATLCTSAGDAASLVRALRDGRLLRPESYQTMATAEGAARTANPPRGVGLRMGQEEGRRSVGVSGSLMGFSSAVLDFPDDSLTIAVLSNTSGQAAARIARALARAALQLPPLPRSAAQEGTPPAERIALTAVERARYVGTYRTRWTGAPGPYQQWQRTYRVFEQNGRLMLQGSGEAPEPLLHQGDHAFSIASWPSARLVFVFLPGRPVTLTLEGPTGALSGQQAEVAWPVDIKPNPKL